jgi:hypothetical protein
MMGRLTFYMTLPLLLAACSSGTTAEIGSDLDSPTVFSNVYTSDAATTTAAATSTTAFP